MSSLTMHFLGPCQIILDGERGPRFRYHKTRALLAYLAVEAHRAHQRSELADLLWPDQSDRGARRSLRHALHDLRQATGDSAAEPPYFLITSETVQFNVASSHWLDVAAFGSWFVAAGRVAGGEEADPRTPPTENTAALEAATVLYRGSFLQDLPAVGSGVFEEWISLRREQLHRQAAWALRRLTVAYEQRGEFGQARGFARRQLELDPWREEAHQSLMRLLARDGQRSAALAQYRTCCRLLALELGVEPSDETRALYEQIRDGRWQEPSGLGPAGGPAASGQPMAVERFIAEVFPLANQRPIQRPGEQSRSPDQSSTMLAPFLAFDTLMAIVNTRFEILHINEPFAESLGQSPDALIGRCLLDQFPEADRPERQQILEHCRLTGQPVCKRITSALGLGQIDVLVFPMVNARGRLECLSTFVRPVGERVRVTFPKAARERRPNQLDLPRPCQDSYPHQALRGR